MDRRIGVHGGRRCLRVHERVRLGVDDSGRRQVGHFQRIFAGETKLNALERQRTVIVYKGRLQRQPLHQQPPEAVVVAIAHAAPHAPDAVPKAEQPPPIPVFAEGPTFLLNALSVKPWTPAHREVCVMVVVHVGVRHGGTFDGVDVHLLHCLHRLPHLLRLLRLLHLRHWPFPTRCSTNPMSKRWRTNNTMYNGHPMR